MGTANEAAGFRWTVGGFWGAVTDGRNDISGVAFNFTVLDKLARGLHDAKVTNRSFFQCQCLPVLFSLLSPSHSSI